MNLNNAVEGKEYVIKSVASVTDKAFEELAK